MAIKRGERSAISCSEDADTTKLVQAALEDSDQFEIIYQCYADRIFSYALESTRSEVLADDITSETMTAAFETLERFDRARGSLSGWLFSIARHRVHHHRRAYARWWRAVNRLREPQIADDPLMSVVEREQAQIVRGALDELSDSDKELLLLRYSACLNNCEISEVLNLSEVAVRTRLSRARRRLRELLEDENERPLEP